MKIRTLFVLAFVSNCTQIVSSEIIQLGTNITIKCSLNVTYPSWDKLNANRSGSVMITFAGNESINPDFYAKERIRYRSNNRDLVLSNVTFKDSGTYQCSKAQKGKSVSIIDVDDLKLNVNCGKDSYGNFSATTGCLSPDAVTLKWIYLLESGTEVANANVDEYMNTTGCFDGKARLTSRFEYRTVFCLRDQQVSVRLIFDHIAKIQTIDCGKKCILDGYTENYYIGCIVIFMIHTVTSGIKVVCLFMKYKCAWRSYSAKVFWVTRLFLIQIILFGLVTVFPPQPDAHFKFDYFMEYVVVSSMGYVFYCLIEVEMQYNPI